MKIYKLNLNRVIIILFFIIQSPLFYGQNPSEISDIVMLANFYKENHGKFAKTKGIDSLHKKYIETPIAKVALFVDELIREKNRIIEPRFLFRMDSTTLKLFHCIVMVNYNMYEKNPKDNHLVARNYLNNDVLIYEQIQQYYNSLFISVVNKNRPFNYSYLNWNLDELGFNDDKEKAVFFLVFIDRLGSQISNYIQAVKGPNWDGIEQYVQLLPKINGEDYFAYSNFDFSDFEMVIYKEKQYFKEYYLPIFYDVLIGHLYMMVEKGFPKNEVLKLYNKSILSQEQYYKYSNNERLLYEISSNLEH